MKKKLFIISFALICISLLLLTSCGKEYTSEDGLVFKKCSGGYSVVRDDGNNSIIQIPDTYNDKPVVEISEAAFANRVDIESVKLGKNIKRIEDNAFNNCQRLESINLPASLEKIGTNAIAYDRVSLIDYEGTYTDWLKKFDILIPNTFNGETLDELTIPDFITEIPNGMFQHCKVKKIIIPDTVTSIGYGAFEFSQVESVVIGDGVKTIAPFAFRGSTLKFVEIGASVESIGYNAFWGTELHCAYVPSSVKEMKLNSFEIVKDSEDETKNLTIFVEAQECPNTWDVYLENIKYVIKWGATYDEYAACRDSHK